jgi:hypothetical protein
VQFDVADFAVNESDRESIGEFENLKGFDVEVNQFCDEISY